MKNQKTFSERMHQEMLPFLKLPRSKKQKQKLFERFQSYLMGEEISNSHLPIVKLTEKRKYIGDIFRKYYEIWISLERIKLSKYFISNISLCGKVSKVDYIRYHYEYFLNELYIFHERMKLFLKFIERKSLKKKLSEDVKKIVQLRKAINVAMENADTIRGAHVHKKRYESNKIDQLSGLDSLSKDSDFIRHYRDFEIQILKRKYVKEIEAIHKELKNFLENTVYKELGKLIFKKLLPKNSHKDCTYK